MPRIFQFFLIRKKNTLPASFIEYIFFIPTNT